MATFDEQYLIKDKDDNIILEQDLIDIIQSGTLVIEDFDEEGNPIDPSDYLYFMKKQKGIKITEK